MISIERALEIIRDQEVETAVEQVPLGDTHGFWLAEDIRSPFDLPSFDNSAMDGYAVSGMSDSYRIVGEIQAGNTSDHALEPGEAVRIFTGAKVPGNTTAVVMQEKTRLEGTVLYVDQTVEMGQHIRRKGEELEAGEKVFSAGHGITPATVGMIGSMGMERVKVFKKPVVRIIGTGDELIAPGKPKADGRIYESNSYSLNAALRKSGFEGRETAHIKDDFSAIKTGIADFLDSSDVLLLSGGISVGEYDFVKQALVENGVTELFHRVFQKPGKPLFFGRKGKTFVFGLPGNPASSLTCFYIYVLPLLQKLSGAGKTGLQKVFLPLTHNYELGSDRPAFLKARIEGRSVTILDGQRSSMIHSMALGNTLVLLKGPIVVEEGDRVECLLI